MATVHPVTAFDTIRPHSGAAEVINQSEAVYPATPQTNATSAAINAAIVAALAAYSTTAATNAARAADIAALVNSAPSTMDTLGEIAALLASDETTAGALATTVGLKLAKASNLSDVASPGLARVNINRGAVALTSGASVATDAATGNAFTLTLGVNATLANPTNLVAGASYAWEIKQDATGSRTLAYGTAFKWAGGSAPVLSTAVNAVDILTAVSFDGTTLRAVLNKAFA